MKKIPWTPILVGAEVVAVVALFDWSFNWSMNFELVFGWFLMSAYAIFCGRMFYDCPKESAECESDRYKRENDTHENAADTLATERCLLYMKWAVYAIGPAMVAGGIVWNRKCDVFLFAYLALVSVSFWGANKGFEPQH